MKKLVIDELKNEHGMTTAAAEESLSQVIGALHKAIRNNPEVRLPGLGTFKTVYRDARTGRNPSTGETVHIAGKNVLKFKPAKDVI